MNIAEAKKTNLVDYLQVNGFSPVRVKYGSAWFLSPMRQEITPSFKVNLDKNVWFDFGSGEGGNIIALVMKLYKVSVSEALHLIGTDTYSPVSIIPEYKNRVISDESGRIKINHIQVLKNPALIQYLDSRNVSLVFAKAYLKEAYYTVHEGKYFALAFENDKGGYELRNSCFKSGSSPKHFTTIPGINNSRTNVFEGFMDFLSCCTYYNRIPRSRTIILNSLSFLPKIEEMLSYAKHINLFLDNDNAGKAATQKIMNMGGMVTNFASVIYPNHKDFNEFMIKRKAQ
jgi:hypothetical protein